MKKIAYIAKNLNVNGISAVIVNYATKLSEEDYIFDIYVGNPISEINVKKIKKYKNINIIKTPNKNLKFIFSYMNFLKKNIKNYDIVHIHGNSHLILLEMIISKINKNKKIICHSHSITSDNIIFHHILTPIFNVLYDTGVACSTNAGVWMFSRKPFEVLKNGIEIKKYKFNEHYRKSIREKYNIKENEIVIGHVGNFSELKNYPFLINVFEKLCDKSPNYKLLLVGNHKNNVKLKNYILDSKYHEKIILYGPTDNVWEVYNAMDIFAFPSKYEGLGIVLIEAQCNGLPCLTSTGVPKEAAVNKELITYLPLEDNCDNWVSTIENITFFDRTSVYEKFYDDILLFDIETTINKLKNIYEGDAGK